MSEDEQKAYHQYAPREEPKTPALDTGEIVVKAIAGILLLPVIAFDILIHSANPIQD